MTTPQNGPQGDAPAPPANEPRQDPNEPQRPAEGRPAPSGGDAPQQNDDAAELRSALAEERKQRHALDVELKKLKAAAMTEQEKAVAAARDEGRSEAVKAAGVKLAAAEFRVAAAGKLADPGAAVELLDLAKWVNDQGDVDSAGLSAVVDKLAAQLNGQQQHGRVPAGPRQTSGEEDFVRAAMGR